MGWGGGGGRRFNPNRPGVGVEGGQKVPALTLNVNTFFNIEGNATKLFLNFIWQQFGMACLGPSNLTFPWQRYIDRHVFRTFDIYLTIFIFLYHFSRSLMFFISF